MRDKEKPDCYKCKYRGQLLMDAHSYCAHPDVKATSDEWDNVAKFVMGQFKPGMIKLRIRGTEHGIRNAWFIWPINFDPVWLENCDGFTPEEKEVKNEK